MAGLSRRVLPPALLLLVLSVVAHASPAKADASIESQVLSRIRQTRSITQHSGLLSVARSHSMGMASRGGLDHNNADSRIRGARPDPMETNGAPDDGSPPASWCENVTYVTGAPQSEVASRMYAAWESSGAHNQCMKGSHRNVGAVGVHYDGEKWWGTFIAMVDDTPPGGPPPSRTTAPAPQESTNRPASSGPQPTTAPAHEPLNTHVNTPVNTPVNTGDTDPGRLLTGIDVEGEITTGAGGAPPRLGSATSPELSRSIAGATSARVASFDVTGATKILTQAVPLTDHVVHFSYGWQELLAIAGLLAVATSLLRRSVRTAPH